MPADNSYHRNTRPAFFYHVDRKELVSKPIIMTTESEELLPVVELAIAYSEYANKPICLTWHVPNTEATVNLVIFFTCDPVKVVLQGYRDLLSQIPTNHILHTEIQKLLKSHENR